MIFLPPKGKIIATALLEFQKKSWKKSSIINLLAYLKERFSAGLFLQKLSMFLQVGAQEQRQVLDKLLLVVHTVFVRLLKLNIILEDFFNIFWDLDWNYNKHIQVVHKI